MLTAPGGFGKSTALRQWARADSRPFGWVALDAVRGDSSRLFSEVVRALDRIEPFGHARLHALTEEPFAVTAVALPRRPFVLVLDDATTATPRLTEIVSVVARAAPLGSTIVISGRDAIDWPGLDDVVHRVARFDSADLAFTSAEAANLFTAVGTDVSAADAHRLSVRTAGWPIGDYLSALLLRDARDRAALVDDLVGGEGDIFVDLGRRLLERLPVDASRFLTHTSVVNRLSGALCDWLLRTSGSAARLEAFARQSLLLVEDQAGTYRCQPLLAELFRSALREEPEQFVLVHQRASDWFVDHDDDAAAVWHAQQAHDVTRAASVIWRRIPRVLPAGGRAVLERWLRGFSVDDIVAEPRLALTAAWGAVHMGQPVEPWVQFAELAANAIGGVPIDDDLRANLTLLRAVAAEGSVGEMTTDAEIAFRLDRPGSPFRAVACSIAGAGHDLLGDTASATVWLTEGVRLAETGELPLVQGQCLAQFATIAFGDGDMALLGRYADEALRVLTAHELADANLGASVFVVAALAAAHRQLPMDARRHADRAVHLLESLDHVMPWLGVQARVLLAHAFAAVDDNDTATALVHAAEVGITRLSDAPKLQTLLDGAMREVEPGRRVRASSLTAVETQVLGYLPSHLSFDDVASRLDLSTSTVRRAAISVFRKLGVVSRRDAVERALVLGLIPVADQAG
jgi:LuxR family maltose regulon positive regulatory protein